MKVLVLLRESVGSDSDEFIVDLTWMEANQSSWNASEKELYAAIKKAVSDPNNMAFYIAPDVDFDKYTNRTPGASDMYVVIYY